MQTTTRLAKADDILGLNEDLARAQRVTAAAMQVVSDARAELDKAQIAERKAHDRLNQALNQARAKVTG